MHRIKEDKKLIYFIVIIFIYIIKNNAFKIKIVIKVIIKTRKKKYKVKVLINSNIKANYIKRKLALNIDILLILKVIPLILLEKEEFIYIEIIFLKLLLRIY